MSVDWDINNISPYYAGANGGCGNYRGRGPRIVDEHDGLAEIDELKKVLKELNDALSDEEKEDLRDMIETHFQEDPAENQKDSQEGGKEAGTGVGGIWTFANVDRVKKKKKWETVIKKWAMKTMRMTFRDEEQWIRINRRFSLIPKEFFLPTEMTTEDLYDEKDKIEVFFFADTSGSCSHLKDRFFTAALSLPENRFHVRMFCFDTKVYETTLESRKLCGFGGTNYQILEDKVQEVMKAEGTRHPTCFVVTDGYGTEIRPADETKWYWFLSENYRNYIPKKSHVYNLSDFE